jgi:hypothetical protein
MHYASRKRRKKANLMTKRNEPEQVTEDEMKNDMPQHKKLAMGDSCGMSKGGKVKGYAKGGMVEQFPPKKMKDEKKSKK